MKGVWGEHTARAYLERAGYPTALQPRFDVVEVYGGEGTTDALRINHLENAFGG